jgi:hypothetical protein
LVQVYKDGVGSFSPAVQCTEDLTAPDNQTWKTNSTNWIPTQFGDNYLVQVYAGAANISNPQTAGTKLFGAGSGSDDTWFFDYQSGVLNFNGATIPTAIGTGTANTIYVVGYRYVGEFGVDTTFISNGTSNVSIGTANANVTISVNGTGNVAVFSNTGAYVSGVVSVSGNVTGNYFIGNGSQLTGIVADVSNKIANGTSNIFVYNNSNIAVTVGNVANTVVFTQTGVNIAGNVSANVITANTFVGNISGNIQAPGANTQVLFNDNGQVGAEADFAYNKTSNTLSVSGNINGAFFNGNGVGLTSTLVDHGGDPNNWDTNLKMGVYTVNRTSWSGTTGAPLDSQVYKGLLEVTNSTNTSASQVFYPGAVTTGDVMIQWNRNYFNGVWTGWVKVINDDQVVHGGDF